MKKFAAIYLLLFFCSLPILAQDATNVRVLQDGENIIITYDLAKQSDVRVFVTTGQSTQYTELKAVIGAVGKNISAGTDLQIIWQPLEERTEFVAQNVRFKIETIYYFSVSADKQVIFSSGNLEYNPSTDSWRFADLSNDWATFLKNSKEGWIDEFGWGTGNEPTEYKKRSVFADWGINEIENDAPNTWYTLSGYEWTYLFIYRPNAKKLFALGTIKGAKEAEDINGIIILPDNWITPDKGTFIPSTDKGLVLLEKEETFFYPFCYGNRKKEKYPTHWSDNVYTALEWKMMESNGAVFLPMYYYPRATAHIEYWASTESDKLRCPQCLHSYQYNGCGLVMGNECDSISRHSVRLVKNIIP